MSLLHDALPEWLDALFVPEPNSGCWLYAGDRETRNGYGRAWERDPPEGERRGERVVHRMTYRRCRGPIPAGHVLDHKCKVRPCANPWHAEPVTVAVNTARGDAVLFSKEIA